jgi:DNA-binding beta-propeller fold protein YncE
MCGMPNAAGTRVCERCGTPLARSSRSPDPVSEDAILAPAAESQLPDTPPEPESELVPEPVAESSTEPQRATGPNLEQSPLEVKTGDERDVAEETPPVTRADPEVATTATPDESEDAAVGSTPVPPTRREASTWSRLDVATRGHLRDQLGRILIGGGVGLLLLVGVLTLLPRTPHPSQAAQDVPQVAIPTPTPRAGTTQAATSGPTSARTIVRQVAVLGQKAGLLAPQEAVQLRNGAIAVVDTGHKRLVILDAHGNLLKSVTGGASSFKDPFAVATAGGTIYVLDSTGDTIDRFTSQGQYRGTVIHDSALDRARGMALGRNGTLLVANPASNSILTLSPSGQILHTLGGAVGAGPTKLDQPSDVASGKGGLIYILDNNNQRVQIVNGADTFTGQRPAPPSSTIASAHVLALPDGRLLVSDPTGALLLYPSNGGSATRIVLRIKGGSTTRISPLGLALATRERVLVTDTSGSRLLVIPVSQL